MPSVILSAFYFKCMQSVVISLLSGSVAFFRGLCDIVK